MASETTPNGVVGDAGWRGDTPPSGTRPSRSIGARLGDLGPVLALILIAGLYSVIAPNFLTVFNLTNVLTQVSIVAIAGVGMTMVILVAGIDLSVGSVVALTGCLAALTLTNAVGEHTFGNAAVAVIVALVVGLAVGLLNGVLVTIGQVPAFIATLATLVAVRGVALLITQAAPVSIPEGPYVDIGRGFVGPVPIPVIIMIVVFAIGYVILHRLRIGRRIYAVGGNIEAARLSGVRVNRVLIFVFAASGLCAGIAGVIVSSKLAGGLPAGANSFELDVIAAVVVGGTSLFGGRGRLLGTFIGALLIGVLGNGLVLMNVSDYWQRILTGAVIVGAVILDRVVRGRAA
jgi:ribose transport system permease protein